MYWVALVAFVVGLLFASNIYNVTLILDPKVLL